MTDKRPWVAFVLSFVLPGAGLAYLGKWSWALGNFLVVQLILLLLVLFTSDTAVWDRFHYILLAMGAGSAGLAHAVAAGQARLIEPVSKA